MRDTIEKRVAAMMNAGIPDDIIQSQLQLSPKQLKKILDKITQPEEEKEE